MKTLSPVLQACLTLLVWQLWTLTDGRAHAQSIIGIVVPNNLRNVEGNAGESVPFVVPTRFQQIYAASEFSTISEGGGWIKEIRFRPTHEWQSSFKSDIRSLQINLSTTSKRPDGLSSVFAENVGADDIVVFPPQSVMLFHFCFSEPRLETFGVLLSFTTNFYYNPNAGNLLLDIRNISGGTNFNLMGALDAQFTQGDSVSIAVNTVDVNGVFASTNTVGLVTWFGVLPLPRLYLSLLATNLLFRWTNHPGAWTLQQSPTLGAGSTWQDAGGTVTTNGNYREVTLPLDTNTNTGFFRLVLPPLGPGAAGVETIVVPAVNSKQEY